MKHRKNTITHVRGMARGYTRMAINILVSIAKDRGAPAGSRVHACEVLLDRGWGKIEDQKERSNESVIFQTLIVNANRSLDEKFNRLLDDGSNISVKKPNGANGSGNGHDPYTDEYGEINDDTDYSPLPGVEDE